MTKQRERHRLHATNQQEFDTTQTFDKISGSSYCSAQCHLKVLYMLVNVELRVELSSISITSTCPLSVTMVPRFL
jgi:hypothetical protein